MSTVTEFLSAVNSAGISRAHKWEVIFAFPSDAGVDSGAIANVNLMARTSTTPQTALGDLGIRFGGRAIPLAGDRSFEDFTMTFLAINDQSAHDSFEAWSDFINAFDSNVGDTIPSDYYQDIVLNLLDSEDNVVKVYTLYDAYPMSIGGSELDRGSENTTMEYTVTFKYLYFLSETI